MVYSYKDIWPEIHTDVYVAPNASVIGDVVLSEGSSCWFGAVLRGDCGKILIGKNSNIQDNAVLHCDEGIPVSIGENVTIGHGAILHSCKIGDHAMIGMGAVILNGAEIGEGAVIAAGTLVREGKVIPPYTLAAGVPAQIKRELPHEANPRVLSNAKEYKRLGMEYKNNMNSPGS